MKNCKPILLAGVMMMMLSSCNLFHSIFGGGGSKNGCPSNGKNVGAERLMTDDPKAKKSIPKAPKYKLSKF